MAAPFLIGRHDIVATVGTRHVKLVQPPLTCDHVALRCRLLKADKQFEVELKMLNGEGELVDTSGRRFRASFQYKSKCDKRKCGNDKCAGVWREVPHKEFANTNNSGPTKPPHLYIGVNVKKAAEKQKLDAEAEMRNGVLTFTKLRASAIGYVNFDQFLDEANPSDKETHGNLKPLVPLRIYVFEVDADGKALVGGLEFTSETIHVEAKPGRKAQRRRAREQAGAGGVSTETEPAAAPHALVQWTCACESLRCPFAPAPSLSRLSCVPCTGDEPSASPPSAGASPPSAGAALHLERFEYAGRARTQGEDEGDAKPAAKKRRAKSAREGTVSGKRTKKSPLAPFHSPVMAFTALTGSHEAQQPVPFQFHEQPFSLEFGEQPLSFPLQRPEALSFEDEQQQQHRDFETERFDGCEAEKSHDFEAEKFDGFEAEKSDEGLPAAEGCEDPAASTRHLLLSDHIRAFRRALQAWQSEAEAYGSNPNAESAQLLRADLVDLREQISLSLEGLELGTPAAAPFSAPGQPAHDDIEEGRDHLSENMDIVFADFSVPAPDSAAAGISAFLSGTPDDSPASSHPCNNAVSCVTEPDADSSTELDVDSSTEEDMFTDTPSHLCMEVQSVSHLESDVSEHVNPGSAPTFDALSRPPSPAFSCISSAAASEIDPACDSVPLDISILLSVISETEQNWAMFLRSELSELLV